ncbi:FCD domain-containing protein [Nocardia sp. R6R-6]|uniref:FCD domain-containing protein n=1 Tax=Nocardia sp. R6R-6 TaxID=3459303 RepID=UPI00403E155E
MLKRLRSAIILNEIPPGTRLIQTSLATQLAVSRMPVRDAINDLISEGLVESLPGGGATVSTLSVADMRAVYAVRSPLEVEAVRWAAATPGLDLSAMDAVLERKLEVSQAGVPGLSTEELWDLDRDFHWAIYAATRNRFLLAALAPVWSQISRIMFAVHSIPDYSEVAWREHEAIAQAIRDGDVDLAESLTREHLSQAANTLIGALAAA